MSTASNCPACGSNQKGYYCDNCDRYWCMDIACPNFHSVVKDQQTGLLKLDLEPVCQKCGSMGRPRELLRTSTTLPRQEMAMSHDGSRDYIQEVQDLLSIPRPLKELLAVNRVGVMEKLFGFLNFRNRRTRKAVACALGQIGDTSAIAQLELSNRDESASTVKAAMNAATETLKHFSGGESTEQERKQYMENIYWKSSPWG